jgi:hypothetical protein
MDGLTAVYRSADSYAVVGLGFRQMSPPVIFPTCFELSFALHTSVSSD